MPNQSNYPEMISARLAKINFETISLNKESAKFAVAMAQSFGFLTSNMFWDWKGHALNIILEENPRNDPKDYLKLTLLEKILYLKYYLEADGATILEFCKRFMPKGNISRNELLSTDFIDRIFIDIWETYRQLTTDLRQKTQLRQNIQELRSRHYTFKTRIHKALAHVEPLVDFDLIERKKENNEILFSRRIINGYAPMDKLVEELKTIEYMELRFAKFQYFRIISDIYTLKPMQYDPQNDSKILREEILRTYLKARTEPSHMAPIMVVTDVVCAKLLVQKGILIERTHIENELERMKSDYSRDIHFHVDMQGKKAFIVLSDRLYKEIN